MNKTIAISAISLIAIMFVIGIMSPAIAKEGNNGNNGCEKSNANSKACEKNPNTTPVGDPCLACDEAFEEATALCISLHGEKNEEYDACVAIASAASNECYDDITSSGTDYLCEA